jgi:2-polyprenyl-6-methoxyphenol hydroxylase-like FAD-dependent oxidoreductase
MTGGKRHVAIVGYGTAGQTAAILLARDGHRVDVYEQTAEPGPVGAGVLLQPVGLQVLWELGILDAALEFGQRVGRLYGTTRSGRAVMDMRYAHLDPRLCGLGMQRGALFSLLVAAVPSEVTVHCGIRIEALEADGRHVGDACGDRDGAFDLILAADGAASILRASAGSPRLDRPYPWGALWCLLDQGDWPHVQVLCQRYVGARKMVGLLPVGHRPGDPVRTLSFFWSLPTAQFDAWSRAGLAPWLEEIRELWPEAHALACRIDDCQRLSRASYRDAIVPSWYRERLVLLGDAAHAMSPQLGQGVNMALLDALALRNALRAESDIDEALACYQRERRAHVSAYQFWSRWLTPLFQSERDLLAGLRDLAFHPLGRLWGCRSLMLRVLSGTQHGLFGKMRINEDFLGVLARCETESPRMPTADAEARVR